MSGLVPHEAAGGNARVMVPDPGTRLLHNLLHHLATNRAARRRDADLRQLLEFSAIAGTAAQSADIADLMHRLRPERRRLLPLQWALASRWLGLGYSPGLPERPVPDLEVAMFESVATQPFARRMFAVYDKALRSPRRGLNVLQRLAGGT